MRVVLGEQVGSRYQIRFRSHCCQIRHYPIRCYQTRFQSRCHQIRFQSRYQSHLLPGWLGTGYRASAIQVA